jgi:hypothetical protein
MTLALRIIFMKYGVVLSVKFQRLDIKTLAEGEVESRRCLHPVPLKIEFCETVKGEDIAPHVLVKALCGEVVTYVSIPEATGDIYHPCSGRQ